MNILKRIVFLLATVILISLNGCATLSSNYQSPEINLVDLKMLPSNGLEQTFELKLRMSNPNDIELPIKGMSYALNVMGNKLASGVSDEAFTLKPFNEEIVTFKVTTNLLQAGRTLLKLVEGKGTTIDYALKGKIKTDKFLLGTIPVNKVGKLDLDKFIK